MTWRRQLPFETTAEEVALIRHWGRSVVRDAFIKTLLKNQSGDCWLCFDTLMHGVATLDHVIPKSLGGGSEKSNFAAAHKDCNQRRGNRIVASDRRTRKVVFVDELPQLPLPQAPELKVTEPAELPPYSLDLETHQIQPGLLVPRLVCGSLATTEQGSGRILPAKGVRAETGEVVRRSGMVITANGTFDLAVLVHEGVITIEEAFACVEEGRFYDIHVAQALDAIANGHLFMDPRTHGKLKDPATGKQVGRYSLAICTDLTLGRVDAKKNDFYRSRYGILEQVPFDQWPEVAKQYPRDDVENTRDVALAQIGEAPRVGYDGKPVVEAFQNLHDLPKQMRAAWALHLATCWGIRTDPERVAALRSKVEAEHKVFEDRFKREGFLRVDGSEDQAAVKRAVAKAYGAKDPCPHCNGAGKVPSSKAPKLTKSGKPSKAAISMVTCKPKKNKDTGDFEVLGCDGTGLDIDACEALPRSDSGGVKTDRDTKSESGDDVLESYAENVSEKIRDTYLPFLESGTKWPINVRPNVIVETGRTSYDGLIQLIPKDGGVRECFVARDGTYFVSIDYAAIELCAFAQVCYLLLGKSRMRDVINETGDPGALHTAMAAKMIGVSFEDLQARIEAGDKMAKDYRQAAKACFHPDTEILTRKGWKKVADLSMEDEVASVVPHENRPEGAGVDRRDPVTGRMLPGDLGREWWAKNGYKCKPSMEIVWTKPIRLTRRKATEGLLHLKNEGMNLRVTPDHRMLSVGSGGKVKVTQAHEFAAHGGDRGWFNAGMWNGGEVVVDERLLRLAVATQADGNYKHEEAEGGERIRFGFSKQRKIDRLLSLLNPGEYEMSLHSNGKVEKKTTSIRLNYDLSAKVKALLDSNKTLPWWWVELTPALREAVLEEAQYWDSHKNAKLRCYLYSTVIQKNVDVLQAIASVTNRKTAHYVEPATRPNRKDAHGLTVRAKYDTRGENLSVDKIDYDGDVVCLSVPSSFVLVRDGGIPVIVGQCNFGLPGGMGAATLVLAKRREGLRFCITLGTAPKCPCGGGDAAKHCRLCYGRGALCGVEKTTNYRGRQIPPTCVECIRLAEDLRKQWISQWEEVTPYFNYVSSQVDSFGQITQLYSDRIRGDVTFTNAANGYFQGLASEGMKSSLYLVSKECYTDKSSPMYGDRPLMAVHDEIFAEIGADHLHEGAYRMAEVWVAGMKEYLPDVVVVADPAAMKNWTKAAITYHDPATNKLRPWEESPLYAEMKAKGKVK